jgi:hypothetical protein
MTAKLKSSSAKPRGTSPRSRQPSSMAINTMHHLHAYLANICAIIEAQFVYDMSL